MRKYFISIIIFIIIIISYNLTKQGEVIAMGNNLKFIYYGGFAGFSIPIKPIDKITKEDAHSRKAFCIGYYDKNNLLVAFEKYIDGNLFFRHRYEYHNNGKIRIFKLENSSGIVAIHYFDKKGKEIEHSEKKSGADINK